MPCAWSEDEGANSGREKESWRINRWSGQKEPEVSTRIWMAMAALLGPLNLTRGSMAAPRRDKTQHLLSSWRTAW